MVETSVDPVFRDLNELGFLERPLHVVILGAGLAGLCAAYELERRGHTCLVLEADPAHVGGRVRTLRFGDGLYGEAGAMRIPGHHHLTRHYIRELGLPIRRFVHDNPEGYYCLRGGRTRIRNYRDLYPLYGLTPAELRKSPDEIWADVVARRIQGLSQREQADLFTPTPVTDSVRSLDRLSLLQLFEQDGVSPEAIELVMDSRGLDVVLRHEAAAETLREETAEVWTQELHEIVGGADGLPAALAARLRSKPRLGCEVVALEQGGTDRRPAAIYHERGRVRRAEGDFVLCTLPFPCLSRVQVRPDFSGPKQTAIRQLHYDSATKVLAIARRRFWESDDGIFGGRTVTDLPSVFTYYPADNADARDPDVSARPAVLLASYCWGQQARRLAALPAAARGACVVRHLARVHPQLGEPGAVNGTASWCWDTHRWSGGAFAFFMPGQHTALHRHVIAPEGRIFFAGEHCSLHHSWMQGAFESALHAARAVLIAARS